MNRRIALTVSSFAVLLLSSRAATSVGDTLDQSQTSTNNYLYVGWDMLGKQHALGQTFTVGMDGYLRRVRVYLENDPVSPTTGPILVSIQTVTIDGLASGREVGNGTIPICSGGDVTPCLSPSGAPEWIDVSISPLIVRAGTQYAIVLRATGSSGHIRWYNFIGPSAYSGGFVVGNDGSGWWALTYDDMVFQTYVTPPALDLSQTETNSRTHFFPGWRAAQTFRAGMSGNLQRVRMLLETDLGWPPTGPVTVSLQTLNGLYFPSGTEVGRGTIALADIPSAYSPAWVDVSICCGNVSAGAYYAIVLSSSGGSIWWYDYSGNPYSYGDELTDGNPGWYVFDGDGSGGFRDTTFQTYVLPFITRSLPPPPRTITPCVNGVCPATNGGLTPADLTDGITSHFLFKERPNGTIQGILDFTDSLSDDVKLSGCTTESAACRLTVETFACTDQHAMLVAGSYQRMGDTYKSSYQLTVSGVKSGPGAITLSIPGLTYTFTRDSIVDVTCPAGGAR